MRDLKKMLNPDDADLLQEQAGVSWVPKDPREVLLPYMSDVPNPEDKDIETRRDKAKQVVDGYTKVIEDCKRTEAEIEQRCKDVKVPLNKAQHLSAMEAVTRIFGVSNPEEITFEMYKVCIRELAKIANDTGAPE